MELLIAYLAVGVIFSAFWIWFVYKQTTVDQEQKDFEAFFGTLVITFLWLPLFIYGLIIRLQRSVLKE